MSDSTSQNLSGCNQARVLVVENEDEYRQLYGILLRHWGYEPVIVEGEGQILLDNAVAMSRDMRCQLALVDMRLLDNSDPNDVSGLELVPKLKPTQSIVVSGFGDHRKAIMSIKQMGAVSFVGKEDGAESLQDELDQAALRFCASRRKLEIIPGHVGKQVNQSLFPGVASPAEDEPAELLARLFPEANRISVERLDDPDRQMVSRAPRPRSMILITHADDFQPVVVKLARAHKVKKEVERYREHIEDRLTGSFSPPLKAWETLWAVGGMVYPFIGATTVENFTRYYASATASDIEHSLEIFFKRTWSGLYAARAQNQKRGIFEAYCDVWDRDWFDTRLAAFEPIVPASEMPAQWRHLHVPDPVAWLKTRIQNKASLPKTALAVTHGDLHGDNMLVDDNRNIWVIDFERSGPGPILQDFVELEADIICRLAGLADEDFASFYSLCRVAAQPEGLGDPAKPTAGNNPELLKAVQVIAALRRLAKEVTGEEDTQQYLWGLLFNALFRATLLDPKTQKRSLQRALMMASILCHRLEHWNEPWPPENWPNL